MNRSQHSARQKASPAQSVRVAQAHIEAASNLFIEAALATREAIRRR